MKTQKQSIKRSNRITVTLSDEEISAIDKYVRRYKSKSRASVVREGVVRFVVGKFIEDYPTLFEESELKQMIERNL